MTKPNVCIVRAPYQYRYDVLNIHEEAIITYLLGSFKQIGFSDYRIFDYHLERDTQFEDLLNDEFTDYVFPLRETGENTHYVLRLVKALAEKVNRPVWVFGQTARLRRFNDLPENVKVLQHSERLLCEALGLSGPEKSFEDGLTLEPYMQKLNLEPWQIRRAKGVIETTRGCHFGCTFCFINQGKNYEKRWLVRPNDAIIADIQRYIDIGIRNFVFYDSEFLGDKNAHYPQKIELLQRIRDELPQIRFKIYCRADTLNRFDQYELLKQAGLVQVFVGAESFYQKDLDALKKRLRSEEIIECINKLKAQDIYANLSFIVFNRNTSVESIEYNLDVIEGLLEEKPRLMGVPSFTFSFESDWRGKSGRPREQRLSDKTYVLHDLQQKEQPAEAQVSVIV